MVIYDPNDPHKDLYDVDNGKQLGLPTSGNTYLQSTQKAQ